MSGEKGTPEFSSLVLGLKGVGFDMCLLSHDDGNCVTLGRRSRKQSCACGLLCLSDSNRCLLYLYICICSSKVPWLSTRADKACDNLLSVSSAGRCMRRCLALDQADPELDDVENVVPLLDDHLVDLWKDNGDVSPTLDSGLGDGGVSTDSDDRRDGSPGAPLPPWVDGYSGRLDFPAPLPEDPDLAPSQGLATDEPTVGAGPALSSSSSHERWASWQSPARSDQWASSG